MSDQIIRLSSFLVVLFALNWKMNCCIMLFLQEHGNVSSVLLSQDIILDIIFTFDDDNIIHCEYLVVTVLS